MKKTVLDKPVLILNRGHIAVDMHSVQHVIGMMYTNAACALDIEPDCSGYRPVSWEEWVTLPIREGDDVVHAAKMNIRAPRVIMAVAYSKIPKKRPKKNLRGVAARDKNICGYTGRVLLPHQRSIDHVTPKSRGGTDDWHNLILADKLVNHKKGNKMNHEAGLKLLKQPKEPHSLPAANFLEPQCPEHEMFLKRD